MSKFTPEFEEAVREKVNPSYVDMRGTESYERKILLDEIDRLRQEVIDARNNNQ